MSLLSRIFGKEKAKYATISLLGPPKSGKTTLVRHIETGEPVVNDLPSTLGIDVRKNSVSISGWSLNAIDTGGQEPYRLAFWELSIQQADALIFVIDATVHESTEFKSYDLMKRQFEYVLKVMPEDMPLLILFNKQDLTELNPMGIEEGKKIFPQDLMQGKVISIVEGSAKYGDGIFEALQWLIHQVSETQ